MSAPRVLRACIVEDGRVLEERQLAPGAPLSIGTEPNNTFVLSDGAAPDTHQLLVQIDGAYELVLEAGIAAKVSVGDEVLDNQALVARGLLKPLGLSARMRLTDENRGKVTVGAYTLIFQFVAPVATAEQLTPPPDFRPHYLRNLDVMYSSILFASTLITIALLLYFRTVPAPAEVTFATMDERFAKLIVPDYEPEKAKPEPPKEKAEPQKAKKVEEKPEPEKVADEADPQVAAKAKAARVEKIREKIAGRGVLAILGAKGAGSGAIADVFGDSNIGGDLDRAFEGISGVGVAGAARTTRGEDAGGAASIGGLATSGGGQVGLGGKQETRVAAVKAETPEVDGKIDSDAVADYVRKRIRSIQDCYERELKRDASLQGKIEVEFTIGESGEVEEARVSANRMGSDAVGDCILSRVRRWKFPAPDGGSVTVNYPFIFSPSS